MNERSKLGTPIQDNINANGGRYVGDEVMRFPKFLKQEVTTMGNGRKPRTITVTGPEMEYTIVVKTLVPVDREDMCREIVANVYGPVTATVVKYEAVK